ncbi:hypothetical protein tinsulaeT_12570 [Thalassotalea insulae]|uniref:STAS domain-containing protein n=1 Tax=Thalassotalea insulae TaxID=2056778 RepID=A0ABQ6GR81_9GAMM|nr:STAS domain-containing protein [Thalassotalea insulae]GLX77917.1 hypothetical protein tinsulaeT_12570 [Thalassotalea insulae]
MLKITQQQQNLILTGELTIHSINTRFEKKSAALLTGQTLRVDLSAVTKMDSAGLAWLLLMCELAAKQGIELKIINLPGDLVNLAKLTAVDSFLPVE